MPPWGGFSGSTGITTAYMHLNSKPDEPVCPIFTASSRYILECETDLQLFAGNIVEVKVMVGVHLAFIVGGHFSGYLLEHE